MSLEFVCRCGQRIQVSEQQAGSRCICPRCRAVLVVPYPSSSSYRPPPRPPQGPSGTGQLPHPMGGEENAPGSGFLTLLVRLFVVWAGLGLISIGIMVMFPRAFLFGLLLGLIATGIFISMVWRLILARRRALVEKDVPLFFDLVRIVAWDPTEGVLFLKNKSISYVDQTIEDGGGIRVIYPILGEELALCVPLEWQSLVFEDSHVLTREYLPLWVRGTLKWRVRDLEKFYYQVSREVHTATDTGFLTTSEGAGVIEATLVDVDRARVPQQAARQKHLVAMHWLRWVAEEETRRIISTISAGLIVAEQVAADLSPEVQKRLQGRIFNPAALLPIAGAEYQSATTGLAESLRKILSPRAGEYGIEVREVSLQEVRLPQAIYNKCVEACQSAFTPLIAEREAAARKLQLMTDAEVIGVDAVAAREVIRHAPAFTLADFLVNFLRQNPNLAKLASPQTAAAIPPGQPPGELGLGHGPGQGLPPKP